MAEPERATSADRGDVVEVLATAFEQDPVFAALMPDARSRPTRLRRFFAIEAGPWALDLGGSWILRDGAAALGAAVVVPSAQRHNPAENHPVTIAAYLRTFGRHSLKARSFLEVIEATHPTEPHLYLPFIGAARPGSGAGSMLLSAMSAAADDAGLPLYLEASTATSARLYRRHGFVDTRTIEAPDMPPLYAMWREPA
ncbi:MAG: GNAT family N-acetyltransferase [Aeromicrobium sp.]